MLNSECKNYMPESSKGTQAFKNPRNEHKIFIYTALPCEAKPLVKHFDLKKNVSIEPFAVYFNDDICLTVSGLGKSAMAAGVAYTQALFASVEHPVIVNIGIAGHKNHALGSLFLIDKIIDVDSQKNYFPPLVFSPPCPTDSIQTASRPQLDYDLPHLCDMEASAFYETATRFASGELILCLKVISDNQLSPAENIQPKQVSALIAAHVLTIETVLSQATGLAEQITTLKPIQFEQLLQHYYFTASERMKLNNQLARWTALTRKPIPDFDETRLHKGKDVLNWLDQLIGKTDFYL
jgi:adenosylhomocysteine nucleosidase